MLKRTITGVVGFLLILPFLWFSDTYAFLVLVQLLCGLSAWELLNCTKFLRHPTVAVPTFLFAVLLPLAARLPSGGDNARFLSVAAMSGFVYLFLLLAFSVFSKGKFPVTDVTLLFALTFYVTVSLSSLILLRDEDCGAYLYLLAFITAWCSDIFAYFCGRAFGRHKLIPEVSPKKTVEGAVGGVLCCVLLTLVYGFAAGKIFGLVPHYGKLALAGAVMSVASMVGDLVMSYVKRYYGVKDYGWILPGHGGILDRFDSVLATGPFLLLLYTLVPSFDLFTAL